MPQRYAPSIFIGLGGHGGNIVDQIALKLKRREDWGKLKKLISFIAIDTDLKDLDRRTGIPEDCRFCISNFNKAVYQQQKVGHGEFANDSDSYFTQWAPKTNEYKFRDAQGAGAGQIRLESRMGLHYNLEEGFGLLRKVDEIVNEAMEIEDPIKSEKAELRCYVFGSIAGGTGSGGFLPIGYWLRDRVQHPWSVKLTYILTLPTLFREKVGKNYPDVCANGYAALMELEYLNSQLGYDGGTAELPFHYSPADKKKVITSRPSTVTYLVDRPANISLTDVPKAIADAIYLLTFSPMLGAVESDLDNYEKHAKMKAGDGFFSTFYGVFGTHVLSFPYNDVIRYATMIKTAEGLKEFLGFSGKDKDIEGNVRDFTVDYSDPRFKRLSDIEKNKKIDDKFIEFVHFRFEEEEKEKLPGFFSQIAPKKPGKESLRNAEGEEIDTEDMAFNPNLPKGPLLEEGDSVWPKFYSKLEQWMDNCEQEISRTVEELKPNRIQASDPTFRSKITKLEAEYRKAQRELDLMKKTIVTNIKSGTFFSELFKEYSLNPIAQRFFLITLANLSIGEGEGKKFIGPYLTEEMNLDYLFDAPVELEKLRKDGKKWEEMLSRSLDVGFFKKTFGDSEADFKRARTNCVRTFNGYVDSVKSNLRVGFWKEIQMALRESIEHFLVIFREVAEQTDQKNRELVRQAESFMVNPAQDKDSDVAQYLVDAEAMRDDTNKRRLWDCMYQHIFNEPSAIRREDLNSIVVDSFRPKIKNGKMKTPTASEVLRYCEEKMNTLVREQFVWMAKDAGLNLQRAIELEARYITVQEQAKANDKPDPFGSEQSRGDLKGLIEAVSITDVESKVEEKISRINRELTVYASLKQGIQSDSSVTAATQKFFALADQNNAQEGFSLGKIVEKNIRGISSVHDTFHDPNKAFFYQSIVNMPLYWLSNVRGDMERLYKEKKEKNKKGAGYIPHHIDWNWETGKINLPILDPVAIKAQKEQENRQRAIQMYLQAFYLGVLVEKEGEINLLFRGRESKMGENHLECWNAYKDMKPSKREMIESEIGERWVEETSRSHLLEPVIERLERMQKETEGLFLDADEQGYTQLIHQLELEIEAIKDMIRTLKSQQT